MCKKTQLDLCCAPIIPALQRLTQEEREFRANLSYTVDPALNNNNQMCRQVLVPNGGVLIDAASDISVSGSCLLTDKV